jgi:hypothetical protein
MKTRVRHVALFSPLLLALACGGCMTSALWQNDDLEAWRQPANKPNLQLFEGNSQTNLLVFYDECSERNNLVHTRAYWEKENQSKLDRKVRPRFAPFSSKDHLPSVPVFYDPIPAGTKLPPGLCAVVATNGQSFTLFNDNFAIGSHSLPVYNDGKGRTEKIALTPLAVTADATIVGPVIAGAIVYCLASSDDVQRKLDKGEYVPIWSQ